MRKNLEIQYIHRLFIPLIILLLLFSIFPLWVAQHHHEKLGDDVYISLTYAKNIVNGNGFIYNYPPPTQGTTSPLLTLCIAGLAKIMFWENLEFIAVLLTSICWIGTAWTFLIFHRAWKLTRWEAIIISLVIIASNWTDALGMEAYLFAFLLILSLSLVLEEFYFFAGLTNGFLFLTRGEGALVIVLMISLVLIRGFRYKTEHRIQIVKNLIRLLSGFAIPIGIWFIYAYITFGNFLPNTLFAKMAQNQSLLWDTLFQKLVNNWVLTWGEPFNISWCSVLNIWWILVFIGTVMVILRRHVWLLLIAWITLYLCGYSIIGIPGYWWYQLPILFVAQVLMAIGLIQCVHFFIRYLRYRVLYLSASIILSAFIILTLTRSTVIAVKNYRGDYRAESYLNICNWFRKNALPNESIAAIEIGYLGYFTDNRIIDLAGLVIPEIVPHISKGDFSWGFWHYQPDYFAYSPDGDCFLADIKNDYRFDRLYRPVASLPGPGKNNFIIYKLKAPLD